MSDFARGPGHHSRSRGAVPAVYADMGALTRACPDCGVHVDEYCRWPDGTERKTPCGGRQHPESESR